MVLKVSILLDVNHTPEGSRARELNPPMLHSLLEAFPAVKQAKIEIGVGICCIAIKLECLRVQIAETGGRCIRRDAMLEYHIRTKQKDCIHEIPSTVLNQEHDFVLRECSKLHVKQLYKLDNA